MKKSAVHLSPSRCFSALRSCLLTLLLAAGFAGTSQAQVPGIISYQGRITVNGSAFNGNGLFKFALVNASGSLTFWSNDGSSTTGNEPTSSIGLAVAGGVYSVLLGANMTEVPPTVFDNPDVRLRVWFTDGTNGMQRLAPDQRIATAGYAMRAATAQTVVNNAITSDKIADGAVTETKIPDGSITPTKLSFVVNGDDSGVPSGAREYATPGSHTFTVPAGVTKIMVEVWGAGAGVYAWHALPGGSGAYSRKSFNVVPGSAWTVTVGAGGAYVDAGPSPAGGNSSFASVSTPSIKLVSQGGRSAIPGIEGLPALALPDPDADIGRTGPTNAEVITGTVTPPLVILDDTQAGNSRILQVHQSSGGPFHPSGEFENNYPGQAGYVLIQW
ncbi:glycine-rich domain-containing protein [Brevifollis gellanilyticus]|uniref:Glycine-rich domain-containing protein n=1 Tax=Brevifollis gellanilyticus TaxID=748831 RepID=A0A512MBH9_9BACT|nr:hypothetical protein [Brevifollis gellanilyticus]GEP44086.1 hypothetical protein BGE01nite_33770 [Brevifollis gellanilyticus]